MLTFQLCKPSGEEITAGQIPPRAKWPDFLVFEGRVFGLDADTAPRISKSRGSSGAFAAPKAARYHEKLAIGIAPIEGTNRFRTGPAIEEPSDEMASIAGRGLKRGKAGVTDAEFKQACAALLGQNP